MCCCAAASWPSLWLVWSPPPYDMWWRSRTQDSRTNGERDETLGRRGRTRQDARKGRKEGRRGRMRGKRATRGTKGGPRARHARELMRIFCARLDLAFSGPCPLPLPLLLLPLPHSRRHYSHSHSHSILFHSIPFDSIRFHSVPAIFHLPYSITLRSARSTSFTSSTPSPEWSRNRITAYDGMRVMCVMRVMRVVRPSGRGTGPPSKQRSEAKRSEAKRGEAKRSEGKRSEAKRRGRRVGDAARGRVSDSKRVPPPHAPHDSRQAHHTAAVAAAEACRMCACLCVRARARVRVRVCVWSAFAHCAPELRPSKA